jgi:hypothetical protein
MAAAVRFPSVYVAKRRGRNQVQMAAPLAA